MKNNISVTVIIPVFNSENTILNTLGMVINQSIPPDEIIVVDNASTDSTIEKCKIYTDKIKVIKNSKNLGPAISRNIGLKNASSEYIQFMDSDDIPTKTYLEERIKTAIKNDSDIVYGKWINAEIKNNKLFTDNFIYQSTKTKYPLISFCLGWILFIPNCLIKKELLLKVGGYPEQHFVSHDILLLCNLLINTQKIHYTPKSTLIVRSDPKRQTSSFSKRQDFYLSIFECYEDCMINLKKHIKSKHKLNLLRILVIFLFIRTKYFSLRYYLSINKKYKFFSNFLDKFIYIVNIPSKILQKSIYGHSKYWELKTKKITKEQIKELNSTGLFFCKN